MNFLLLINTHNKTNESSNRNRATWTCGKIAPMAMLSVIAFFANVAQLTAKPRAIMENTKPGCTAFATGNGSLK